jgi:hypothetical protein
MKRFSGAAASLLIAAISLTLAACTADVSTDSLAIQYGEVKIVVENSAGKKALSGNFTVRLINRTEKQMNVGFLEAEIISGATKEKLVTFRPIIPDAYGSISTVRLLPKETKDVPVVLPYGLDAFDTSVHTTVSVGMFFQTTDGYRATIHSDAVPVATK